MRHLPLSCLSTTLLTTLLLHPTTPFLPSHADTSLRITNVYPAFRFYAARNNDGKKRKIHIHVEQNVNMQRSAKSEDDGDGNAVGKDGLNQEQDPSQDDGADSLSSNIQAEAVDASTQQRSEPPLELPPERRRKRDMFKRAFGIGTSIPTDEDNIETGMEVIPDDDISTELNAIIEQMDEEETVYYEDDELDMPNFLTDEDEARLNATYSELREEGMQKVMREFEEGEYANVTLEEAIKIVDYAVDTEFKTERDKLNQQRSVEALKEINQEAEEKEEQLVAEITSDGIDKALERDAVVRDMVTTEQNIEEYERSIQQKIDELRAYGKELSMNEQETVASITRQILEENPDPNLTYSTVFEAVVNGIQKSRREKLSGPTFGVMGNTIQLEQARQLGRISREYDEKEQAAREEALAKGYCDEAELDDFFRVPTDAEGERMFRSICRNVIEKRPPLEVEDVGEEEMGDTEEDEDDENGFNEVWSVGPDPIVRSDPFYLDEDAKKMYTLTPSEKVEVFKLLKDWRVVQDSRSEAIREEIRPQNTIKPLFLYTEESKRTEEWDKRETSKALRNQLQTDDEVEKASNELLIKELLEGGYTKERSLRLVDKLIAKATDKIIKEALLDVKAELLESEETPAEEDEDSDKPLFVDIKQVLTRDDEDDKPFPPAQSLQPRDTIKTVKPIQSIPTKPTVDYQQDQPAAPRPKSEFFASSTGVNTDPNKGATTSELLGSYEDQLLDKLAKNTGVQTEEQKAELKRNLDEINALRGKGYSDVEDENVARERAARLGIDLDKLVDEDGDSDAQLSALLSKRPAASKKSEQHELVETDGHLEEIREETDDDVVSARYRALFAADDVGEAEFRRYLAQEEEMRAKADNETVESLSEDVDIEQYAEDVALNLKPRPLPSEMVEPPEEEVRRLESMYEKEDEEFDPFPVADSNTPAWLEKEAEAQGLRRKASSKDVLSDEQMARIEERQRLADAYFENEPVDIAEVLDRPYFGSMDEPDYKRKASFMSSYDRKDELLEYTTLVKEDIINYVAWKQDPALSGVNKQLRQIQKPFSEFGAIFRLEGVFVDLVGMQAKAWPKTAERFGLPLQSEDLIRKASLYTPAKAIREVFGWTDDVVEVEQLVKAYYSEFNDAFNAWLEHDRAFVYRNDSIRRNNSGNKRAVAMSMDNKKSQPSKQEIYETYHLAWNKLAQEKNKSPPNAQQVVKGIQMRDWEECIPKVFGWTELSAEQIFDIVSEYDSIIKADMKTLRQKYQSDDDEEEGSAKVTPMAEMPRPSKEEINTSYVIAWNKLALEIGQTSPSKEEVMKGVELRDWQACVKDVFRWSEDDKEIYDIVKKYDRIIQSDLKVLYSNYGFDYGNKFANKYPNLIFQRGVKEFLDKLDSVEMPFAIMSHLGRSQLDAVLDVIGLADYFPPEMRISLDSRYTDERSELLGGALRVEKHPEKCILFENTPLAAETAHEVLMKCVSFVDPYPRYELNAADWSIGALSSMELNVIRTLFSAREDDIPLELAEAEGILNKRPSSIKTGFDMGA